jgi:hypothetical protein
LGDRKLLVAGNHDGVDALRLTWAEPPVESRVVELDGVRPAPRRLDDPDRRVLGLPRHARPQPPPEGGRHDGCHVLLPWTHRVFSNLKRLAVGVNHGFRRKHVQAYLAEFVFRWNRRRHYRSAFDMLFGIGLRTAPLDYWALIARKSPN